MFERRETTERIRNVYVYTGAPSLADMREVKGDHPVRTVVPVPGCGKDESPCSLVDFAKVVEQGLDRNCSQ